MATWEEKNDKALERDIKKGSGTYPSLAYLKLTKRQQIASKPLEMALDSSVPNCQDRSAEFIDYHEDETPTPARAYALCNGCPILVECGRFANTLRPAVGVWAGEVWEGGKVIKDGNNEN
mgnify:CR=1 FL=1